MRHSCGALVIGRSRPSDRASSSLQLHARAKQLDEQRLALGVYLARFVSQPRLDEDLAAFDVSQSTIRRGRQTRSASGAVVDGDPRADDGMSVHPADGAHGFVQDRGDRSAVNILGRPLARRPKPHTRVQVIARRLTKVDHAGPVRRLLARDERVGRGRRRERPNRNPPGHRCWQRRLLFEQRCDIQSSTTVTLQTSPQSRLRSHIARSRADR